VRTVPNALLPSGYPVHRLRAYAPAVEQGDRVEVRSRFQREWSRGFEVVEVVDGDAIRYRVKRRHDDAILPTLFAEDEVRGEHRRRETWWV
jgi:hypothetical protein